MRATAIRTGVALGLSLVLSLAGALPAHAGALEPTRDRLDGSTGFTYDADSGTFPADGIYTSGTRISLDDPVTFSASASPQEGAEVGQRLLGRLTLSLNGTRPVHYAGTFNFKVQSTEGVVYRTSQVSDFTLRPQAGKRKKTLLFPFDLSTSGFYSTGGGFIGTP